MRIAVSRAPGVERVVTPLALFFDLVYVFAIGQLASPARARRSADWRRDGHHGARDRLRLVHDCSCSRLVAALSVGGDSLMFLTEASLRPFQARLARERELPVRKRV
jgi:hypothetical protein